MSFTVDVRRALAALATTALLIAPTIADPADPAAGKPSGSGQVAFNNHCRTCHSAKAGDNRLGPTLHGIVGAKAGANSGFPGYSQAMRSADLVWDDATLDKFMADPEAVVPNNNMKPFKSVPDASVRKAILDYLKSTKAAG